jgi:hypothetical protein
MRHVQHRLERMTRVFLAGAPRITTQVRLAFAVETLLGYT